ncbi:hypothetical protein FSP39_001071 [Pinctada imbricata]|uniref:Caveolin n=1 Tax=Pinctada imbricata TaxID=66713 RepID=A0AA89C9K1_PINIB|nr:hypothetical protein FSP39_001071 [Pinctada imbricata]
MIMTTLFGCCIAAEWGIEFAYVAFWHIWYVTPCFKMLEINCGCCKKLYGLCVHCCLDPLFEACGLMLPHSNEVDERQRPLTPPTSR